MNLNTSEDWLNQLNKLFGNIKPKNKSEVKRRLLDEDGIWELHMRGLSNREIARLLGKSSRTIDRRIRYMADIKSGCKPKRLRDY